MKTLRLFVASAAAVMLAASCLNDEESYQAGFVFGKSTVCNVFANTTVDTIAMFSYGPWAVGAVNGNPSWCTITTMQGKGYASYVIPVHFQQNTTGEARAAQFKFVDTAHPDKAYAGLLYWQFATRGDGTLGNAHDVKAITGSDGSSFTMTYDEQHRPLSLKVTKAGQTLHSLQLSYNDRDSLLTVSDQSRTLQSSYDADYQPEMLIGNSDTIGYYAQYSSLYMALPATHAFNLEHHRQGQATKRYAYLLGGQSLQPDSLHCADSLRIDDGRSVRHLKFIYSKADNRCQSVDVNQLLFGAEDCDPYQLLSLFRYTRSTSIVSNTEGREAADRMIVSTTLNADKSVSTMTVARQGEEITYTLEY